MDETIEGLECRRDSLYRRLEEVGDLRRGMISVNYRKCGKPNCACAKEGHRGHGPQYLWNTTIKGKSYAKNVKLGPELKKYMTEIANYHNFQKYCEEIVAVSEKICNLRPVPEVRDKDELEELKKKLQKHFMKRYKEKLTG